MRPTCTTLLALLAVLAFLFDSLHTVEQQASTSTCFLVNATASVPNPVPFLKPISTKISNLFVRKDSKARVGGKLEILGGSISGQTVIPKTLPINNIGGQYQYGYNPGNGLPAITCKNKRVGGDKDACDCLLITAFGFNSLTTPTKMVAYAIDKCFNDIGEWTEPILVKTAKCP